MISLKKYIFLLCLLPFSVRAVIVVDPSLDNVTAPIDDFGLSNVGALKGATGVYLGDQWVLTAAHVGAGSITLGGVSYSYDGVNSNNIGSADLTLFRLSSDPGLDSLTIASTLLPRDSLVYLAGNGKNQGDPITWSGLDGYEYASGNQITWGTNNYDSKITIEAGAYNTNTLRMSFDYSEGGYESVVADGDSGGGVFYKNGDTWELVGINILLGGYPTQADGTAIDGNITYSVNLVEYAAEINAYMAAVPEPRHLALLFSFLTFIAILRKRKIL